MLELLVRRQTRAHGQRICVTYNKIGNSHGGVWRNPLQVGLQKQTAMVLCLLSRGSHGDRTKLNHEETSEDLKSPFYSKKFFLIFTFIRTMDQKK
jgi:hypothetical protein